MQNTNALQAQLAVLIETLWNVKKPRLMDWEQDGDMY